MPDHPHRRSNDGHVDWWKATTLVLAGVVVSGLAIWLLLPRELVSRQEVIELVRTYSPYVEDRKVLKELAEQNAKQLATMATELSSIRIEQARIMALLAMWSKDETPKATRP
jgi:hypothetical protein